MSLRAGLAGALVAAAVAAGAVAAGVVACVSPSPAPCGDGWCATGETCVDGRCVSGALCGDGVPEGNEECDEGAANSDQPGASCRPDCTAAGCGDAILDPGEQCDPPEGLSAVEPSACRPACRLAHCGDGVVDPGEERGCLEPPRPTPHELRGAVRSGDLDFDGTLDLVTVDDGGAGATLVVYRGPFLTASAVSAATPHSIGALFVTDVDGVPGDEIVTYSSGPGQLTVWRLVGAQLQPDAPQALGAGERLAGLADVDGDGAVDVVTTLDAQVVGGKARALVRARLPDGSLGAAIVTTLEAEVIESVSLAQLFADPRADLVVGGAGTAKVWVHAGQAGGGFGEPLVIPVDLASAPGEGHATAVADYNGDGLMDLAVAGTSRVLLYVQTLGDDFVLLRSLDVDGAPFALAATDMDGDGRAELVTLAMTGVQWLAPDEGLVSPPMPFGSSASGLDLAIVDLEGDGFNDVLVSGNPGAFVLRGGDGLLGAPRVVLDDTPDVFAELDADVDGDGLDDLLVVGDPGFVALGALGGKIRALPLDGLPDAAWYRRGDLDGDGADEIYVLTLGAIERWSWNPASEALELDETASFGGSELSDAVAGDFDGDGREELAYLGAAGLMRLVRAPGGDLEVAESLPAPGGELGTVALVAGDADADGDDELVLLGHEQAWLWSGGPDGLVAAGDTGELAGLGLIGAFADVEPGAGDELVVFSKAEVIVARWTPGAAPIVRSRLDVAGKPLSLTVVDLNDDGHEDVLAANGLEGLQPWMARGDGSLLALPPPPGLSAFGFAVVRDAGGRAARLLVSTSFDEVRAGAVVFTVRTPTPPEPGGP